MYKKCSTAALLIVHLITSCTPQNMIIGNWISERPEKTASGSFAVRQFNIAKDFWEVQYSAYQDSFLRLPVFTFRAIGKYSINERSSTVKEGKEAVFYFNKKYVTLKTNDTVLLRKFGLEKCDLIFLQEKDITETGCAYFVSKTVCSQEFDILSLAGKMLHLGARPVNGGLCEVSKRPKALGLPLKRVTK